MCQKGHNSTLAIRTSLIWNCEAGKWLKNCKNKQRTVLYTIKRFRETDLCEMRPGIGQNCEDTYRGWWGQFMQRSWHQKDQCSNKALRLKYPKPQSGELSKMTSIWPHLSLDSLKRKLKATWTDLGGETICALCTWVPHQLEAVVKANRGHFE